MASPNRACYTTPSCGAAVVCTTIITGPTSRAVPRAYPIQFESARPQRRAFLFCEVLLTSTTKLDFSKLEGLLPAVVTDAQTGRVLMLGFLNEESWEKSLETGLVTFWSRSRSKLWTKGETSGHTLRIQEIRTDCDFDSIEFRVEAVGPGVCHEGFQSCFSWKWDADRWQRADNATYNPAEVYSK
jgi:phosphoribosyl-AMP cyclohydrolase